MFFLDLNFANVARVLNNLGNVRFVSATNFTCNALSQIGEPPIHPILPEYTNTVTEWRKVRLDHTECSMDRPEHEEDNEKVMSVPEAFEICTSRFFCSCECNRHERKQHDISTPPRTGSKIGQDETHKSKVVAGGKPGEIVPMRNSMNPRKEHN